MPQETDFFFVYGSLKKGNSVSQMFDVFRTNSEVAFIRGYDLFDFGRFPGIRPGEGIVTGEVHEYKNVDAVLATMDRIEGYFGNNEQSLYLRKRETVITANGKEIEAYIYVFNRLLPSYAKKIEDGVWIWKGLLTYT